MKTVSVILLILLAMFSVACTAKEAEPEGPRVIQTEGLTPTATPVRPPTPTVNPEIAIQKRIDDAIAKAMASLVPTPPAAPAITPPVIATLLPEPTPTRTPRPTPAPTATPKPIIRPVAPPSSSGESLQLINSLSISISGHVLRVSGNIEGQGNEPTSIQVWQGWEAEAYSATCSTERPIAFIQPGSGDGGYTGLSSPYEWTFCTDGVSHKPIVDQIPWMASQTWSYQLRHRTYIYDPYIYDLSVVASLDHHLVERLEYSDGVLEGWRIVVFSGDRMIASRWIDR